MESYFSIKLEYYFIKITKCHLLGGKVAQWIKVLSYANKVV